MTKFGSCFTHSIFGSSGRPRDLWAGVNPCRLLRLGRVHECTNVRPATGRNRRPLERCFVRAAIPVAISIFAASSGGARACNSGPDFCTDDPRIPAALTAKKRNLADHGYAARLVGLLDIGVQCVARIEREPDGFRLIDVRDDSHLTRPRSIGQTTRKMLPKTI
jgi:hypothetical protein